MRQCRLPLPEEGDARPVKGDATPASGRAEFGMGWVGLGGELSIVRWKERGRGRGRGVELKEAH